MKNQIELEKKVLGKGLSALIASNPIKFTVNKDSTWQNLSLNQIVPNPYQPRKEFKEHELNELASSIKEFGILQPLIVRKFEGHYQLIAGERRLQAAQKCGLKIVPVIITKYNDLEMFEVALVENLQRENLNIIEEANAYKKLIDDYRITQEQVAKRIGRSRSYIANTLRLLNLPKEVIDKIISGKLSASHARNLIGKSNALELAQKIEDNHLSVREVEQLNKGNKGNLPYNSQSSGEYKEIADSLTNALGIPVTIREDHTGGNVNIRYSSLEELDRIIQLLNNDKLNF